MARTKPLTEADLGVARRLQTLRVSFLLSRDELAKLASLSSGTIVRAEMARMPLRHDDAVDILHGLTWERWEFDGINPLWLAHEEEIPIVGWPIILPKTKDVGLPVNTTFLAFVDQNRVILQSLVRDPDNAILPQRWLDAYGRRIGSFAVDVQNLKDSFDYVDRLWWRSVSHYPSYRQENWHWLKEGHKNPNFPKITLDIDSVIRNSSPMKPELQRLLDRVRKLTEARGMKSALAEFLQVRPSSVTEWLDGKYEPGGGLTLKLLQWVEDQEGKK